MKPLLFLITAVCLLAQETPEGLAYTGTMDAGYRWRGDVGGSNEAYRSIVDLASGLRLLDFDFRIDDGKQRFFDSASLRASGWGGDPYNATYFNIAKPGVYRISAGYRNLAYFNFLPSFANPQLERGGLLNQHGFDTNRRMSEVNIDLFPSRRLKPFFAISRDAGEGAGVTTFVAEGNEYAVTNLPKDHTNRYRGGVRWETTRVQATLEQGATQFSDDQRVYTSDPNRGNRSTSFLGQQLNLGTLEQSWTARGTGNFTRIALLASPASWLDVNVQAQYTRPDTQTSYFQAATGRFANLTTLTFTEQIQQSIISGAQQPHASGSAGFEMRPWRGLRIVESFHTDRLRQQGIAIPRLEQSQQQMTVFYDFSRRLSIWGGHRYTWGDVTLRQAYNSGDASTSRTLQRNTALAGVRLRPASRLTLNADLESAKSGSTYFNTSLANYSRIRTRSRYQVTDSMAIAADASYWKNENPTPGADFVSRFWDAGASLLWTPAKKGVVVMTAYNRTRSVQDFWRIAPDTMTLQQSNNRDLLHSGSASIEYPMFRSGGIRAGGTYFIAAGTRPTRFYQPDAQISAPLCKGVHVLVQWRWYGFSESLQAFESFRSHQIVAGLRFGGAR